MASKGPVHTFEELFLRDLVTNDQLSHLGVLGTEVVCRPDGTWTRMDLIWTYKGTRQRVNAYVRAHEQWLAVMFTGAPLMEYQDYRELLERLSGFNRECGSANSVKKSP